MSRTAAIVLAFLLGLVAVPAGAWLYLRFGHPPVATSAQPLPFEADIAMGALHRRVAEDMPTHPPFSPTPEDLVAGARLYREECAYCHGLPNFPSPIRSGMFPHPPQLWEHESATVVGVSDDPPGATFWKIQNGIRLSGMPSFNDHLSDQQMWQISFLLAAADKPLPLPADDLLAHPLQHP